MKLTSLKTVLLTAVVLVSATSAWAKDPVDVEANSMEINDEKRQATFTGTVVATRPNDKMQADVMVVDYADKKQDDGTTSTQVSYVTATGNVTITTKSQVITGQKAIMNIEKDTLVVTGNAKIVQGKTVLSGPKLVVDLKTNNTSVVNDGTARVKATFVPK